MGKTADKPTNTLNTGISIVVPEDRRLKEYKPTRFMAPDSHYDKAAADYAVDFIQALKHTKGAFAGAPFQLIDWEEDLVRTIFGTIKSNGYRQFNTAYVELAKKSGKTELAAAIALYMLCADGEVGAECYGAAADRNQARLIYQVMIDMIRLCPALDKRCKILESQRRILYLPTNSFYQVLSADAYRQHGLNVHLACIDELHVQPDRRLYDVLTKGAGAARTQPLTFAISTAGSDINSICYEVHSKAVDILEGRKHDPTFYPVIYSAPMDADWTDPEVWKMANPSLGITVSMENMAAACESAKETPAEENSFRQLRLSQWTKQTTRWMPMQKWDACAFPVDESELEGRTCYAGLDLSSTTDVTALSLVFPPLDEEDKYQILCYCWLPEENLSLRVRRDHVPYDQWVNEEHFMVTPGNVIHYAFIVEFIRKLGERFHIREIAYDRWSATYVSQQLEDDGFTMVPFGQGFRSMNEPTQALMKLTFEGKIAHGGNPVLRWMMDNVCVRTDPAGNIKVDKSRSTEKVDAVVATVMALDRAMKGAADDSAVYSRDGILFI